MIGFFPFILRSAGLEAKAPTVSDLALTGSGEIHTRLSVEVEGTTGSPATALEYQWRRDDEDIADATEDSLLLQPADDLAAITCRVMARNAEGIATVVTEPVVARYAPPSAQGFLFDEVFDVGTGPQTIVAGADFIGENLSFSVTGAGASIDPEAGVVTVSTATATEGTEIEVSAANSGGTATSAFMVTVEAEEALPLRLITFDSAEALKNLTTNHDGSSVHTTLTYGAPGSTFDGQPIHYPSSYGNFGGTEDISQEVEAAGRAIVNIDQNGDNAYVFFETYVPAGMNVELGMIGAGGNGGFAWARTVLADGTYIEGSGGGSSASVDAPVLSANIDAAPQPRVLRFRCKMDSNADHWRSFSAIFVRNRDGGEAPEILDQGSEGSNIVTDPNTYYIDTVGGDNANDGLSESTPWKSASGIVAGTTLKYKGGQPLKLDGTWTIDQNGTAANPITLDFNSDGSWGTGPAIIECGDELPAPTDNGDGTYTLSDPETDSIWQGVQKIRAAQLPTPANLQNPENTDEFALADNIDGSAKTITAPSFFSQFSTSLVGSTALLWVSGNFVEKFTITGYDSGTGTITVADSGNQFDPYGSSSKWRFAVADHPDAMAVPGQFYTDANGDKVLRPFGDVDATQETFYTPDLNFAIKVTGDYVRLKGGALQHFASSDGLNFDNCTRSSVEGLDVRQANGRTGIRMERTTTECMVKDCHVHDITNARGIHDFGTDNLIAGNLVERCGGTQASAYGTTNGAWLGNEIGNTYGAHVNGISCYSGNENLTMAFNRVRPSGGTPITQQNGKGGVQVVLNELIKAGDEGEYALAIWGPSRNSRYEDAGYRISNNVLLCQGASAKAFNPYTFVVAESWFTNNIVDGVLTGKDQGFDDRRTFLEWDVVSGGSGYSEGDNISPTWPNSGHDLVLEANTNSPLSQETDLRLRRGGAYDPADVPADLSSVATTTDGAGSGLTLSLVSSHYAPKEITGNIHTRIYSAGVWAQSGVIADHGDVDASGQRAAVFTDISSPDVDNWDVTPSGTVSVTGGYSWTFTISHPLLPNFPAGGIAIDHKGRYLPDGSDVANWRDWLAD